MSCRCCATCATPTTTGRCWCTCITEKGNGYGPAEKAADKYHGVNKFDVVTGIQVKTPTAAPSYTKVFSDTLIKMAEKDEKIVAINAAMPSGTGLDKFAEKFPKRCFDVGIAEQHAVTFAAGLATEGMRPFAAIYSTFLQRAYDQVVHDVAIQKLPVRFAIDRAGLVGDDGATHAGSYDVTYLGCLPDFVIMAAADEAELVNMMATARPSTTARARSAIRAARAWACHAGSCRAAGDRQGPHRSAKARPSPSSASGTRLQECLKAADELQAHGLSTTVADARFAKPLDTDMIRRLAAGA